MNLKIRDTETFKIPYVLVVGDKEVATDSVSCRNRSTKSSQTLSFADFIAQIQHTIKNKVFTC